MRIVPGISESGLCESGHLGLLIVTRFVLHRRHVPDRFEQAPRVEPVHPLQRRELHEFETPPSAKSVGAARLVQPICPIHHTRRGASRPPGTAVPGRRLMTRCCVNSRAAGARSRRPLSRIGDAILRFRRQERAGDRCGRAPFPTSAGLGEQHPTRFDRLVQPAHRERLPDPSTSPRESWSR